MMGSLIIRRFCQPVAPFPESDVLRHIFERVVWTAMAMRLVAGVASLLEANAIGYRGKAANALDWS
jgi:hypothetical protein